jgi:hypothetical protein
MEVDPVPANPPQAQPAPPIDTAYAPIDRKAAAAVIYCIRCGTKIAPTEDACPGCGYRIDDLLDEPAPQPRRPVRRDLQPARGFLPVAGAILIPLGVAAYLVGLAVSDGFRRPGSPSFVVGILFVLLAMLFEFISLTFFLTWLYQAWRIVLSDDEEYSPGLMVGLLFVPVFNFYWIFRAIPGLSTAIRREMTNLAPHRAGASGWIVGVIACVLALIPPLWPIAPCMFVAWVLIANDAVNRIVRLHDALGARMSGPRDSLARRPSEGDD